MKKCTECGRENALKYYKKGTQCDYCYKKNRRLNDPEFCAKTASEHKRWRSKNIEYVKAYGKKYYQDNKEHLIEVNSARLKRPVYAKSCPYCGTNFEGNKGKKYCKQECSDKATEISKKNKYLKNFKPKQYTTKCRICNTDMDVNSISRNLCGEECRKKAKNIRVRNRIKTNPQAKIADSLRKRLTNACKNGKSTLEIVGCSWKQVVEYLESKFQPGMTWENHGLRGWHIDHIRPLCSFDLTDPEQVLQASHYTNLQPLWAKDNLQKSGKYESEQLEE